MNNNSYLHNPAPDYKPTNSPAAKPSFTGPLLGLGALVAIVSIGLIFMARNLKTRQVTTQQVASGITLTKTIINTPGAEIPVYSVFAQKSAGWKLRLVTAGPRVIDKTSVTNIVAREGNANTIPIGVNGGYFAYDGAAMGAVKLDGQWQRLAWKNRTAIGWTADGKTKIGNLQSEAHVVINDTKIPVANLNGHPLADAATLLSERFDNSYMLRDGESAITFSNGKITRIQSSGKVLLLPNQKTLIAGASLLSKNNFKVGDSARFDVMVTPDDWNNYPTILGAGPRLLENGQIKVTHVAEEFKPDVIGRGPRTALGVDAQGNLIFLVIEAWYNDPKTDTFVKGVSLEALASEMQRTGAVEAINLDGGSSTQLIVNGKSITHKPDLMQGINIIEYGPKRKEVKVSNAILLTK